MDDARDVAAIMVVQNAYAVAIDRRDSAAASCYPHAVLVASDGATARSAFGEWIPHPDLGSGPRVVPAWHAVRAAAERAGRDPATLGLQGQIRLREASTVAGRASRRFCYGRRPLEGGHQMKRRVVSAEDDWKSEWRRT